MKLSLFIFGFLLSAILLLGNTAPVVSNVTGSQRYDGSSLIDVYYDISDTDGDSLHISMEVSGDYGETWNLSCNYVTGDIGADIVPGNGKHIIWDVGSEHPDTEFEVIIKIIADDGTNTVTDIDGNEYQTLMIGDQEWIVEKLKVTHYSNGDSIPNITNNAAWSLLYTDQTGAYCYYNNVSPNGDTYGALYNWFAVDDPRGLAPEGWHVATDEEIIELEMYLGMSYEEAHNTGFRGTNEGSKLAGTSELWEDGNLENDPGFGSSNFDYLPGGFRYSFNGDFGGIINFGRLWSSTENGDIQAWYRNLFYNDTTISRDYDHKHFGFSVRCVKDSSSARDIGFDISEPVYINTAVDIYQISFLPDEDGWQLGNAETRLEYPYNGDYIMWPEYWWTQFDYTEDYPDKFHQFSSQRFPDWPLFVEVFGEDKCYLDPLLGLNYNPIAVMNWIQISNAKKDSVGQYWYWGGSSFGFALSAAQYYCYEEDFMAKFSDIGNFTDLYSIDITDNRRLCINHCYTQQFGYQHKVYLNSVKNKTPAETLEEIKQMFLNSESDISLLTICKNDGKSRHSVNPFRIEISDESAKIYVYDSNYPGSMSKYVSVNLVTDTWEYSTLNGFEGSTGLFLREPCSEYFNEPIINISSIREDSEFLDLYCVSDADILMHNSIGETLSNTDSGVINGFSDGIPIIPESGIYSEPLGYFIPKGNYIVNASNFADSSAYYYFISDSSYYSFYRNDADVTQNDIIEFSDQQKRISIINEDFIEKEGNLEICFASNTESQIISISDFSLTENDSLKMQVQGDSYNIINQGSLKSYDLQINYRTSDLDSTFEHFAIELENNSSHILEPDWNDLSEIQIYIDEGIDGSIDDTLIVGNQVIPIAPANVTILKVGDTIHISWDHVSGCTYTVYSSDNLFLPQNMWYFEIDDLESNYWDMPLTEYEKRFFYIKAVKSD